MPRPLLAGVTRLWTTLEAATRLPRWLLALVGVAVAIFGVTLCRRGIILSDEGFLLQQTLDLTRGRVLYRDMDAFVAPGAWFVLAGLFSLVEPTVLVARVTSFASYVLTAWACYRIVTRMSGPVYAVGTVGVLLVFSVWAFPAWTIPFYSPFAILAVLLGLDRLLAWQAEERGRDLVLLGVCLGAAVVLKQNYGAFALAGSGVAVLAALCESRRSVGGVLRALPPTGLRVAAGIAVVVVPSLGYFAYHGALADAYYALAVQPFRDFLGTHNIAYLGLDEFLERKRMAGVGAYTYGAYPMVKGGFAFRWPAPLVRLVEQVHVAHYWLPPLLFVLAAGVFVRSLWRRRPDMPLFSLGIVAGLVFLGVFPRADYNHLVNVYQPIIPLAAVVLYRLLHLENGGTVWDRLGVVLIVMVLVPTGVVAVLWYRDIMRQLNTPVGGPRGGVLVDSWEAGMIDFEVDAIRARTRDDEPVLTLPGLAMLNFLAERPMPSRYYNFYFVHIAHDQGASVVAASEAADVRLAVVEYNNFFSDTVSLREYAPVLTRYLRDSFAPLFSVALDKHLFLTRRPTPRAARASSDVLTDCNVVPPDVWSNRMVRERLYFRTLQHIIEPQGRPMGQTLETACRVRVPEDGTLVVQVGYRQPTAVLEPSTLVAEVWVRPAGAPSEEDLSETDTPLDLPPALADTPRRALTSAVHGAEGASPLKTQLTGDGELLLQVGLPVAAVEDWASPAAAEYRVDVSAFAGTETTLVFRTIFAGRVQTNPLDFSGFAAVWHDPRIESGGPVPPARTGSR